MSSNLLQTKLAKTFRVGLVLMLFFSIGFAQEGTGTITDGAGVTL